MSILLLFCILINILGTNWKMDAENTFKQMNTLTAGSVAPLILTFQVILKGVAEIFLFLNKTDIYGNAGGFSLIGLNYVAILEDASHKEIQCKVFTVENDDSIIFNIRVPFILLKVINKIFIYDK